MMIIRPIRESDTDSFINLAFQATLGMRNLPKNKERLIKKIALSLNSFEKNVTAPDRELYLFVLEDLAAKQLAGVCALWTINGIHNEELFYHIETTASPCKWEEAPKEIKSLKVVCPKESITELGALYLHPSFHHQGLGPLLSLSRFLFTAAHPKRFFQKVTADLRGIIHHNQIAPFWDGVGRHFCNITFPELMSRLDQNPSVIPSLLPTYPIYISFLSGDTQKAIGAIHQATAGAWKMLDKEGFTLTNDIDLFDGGPRAVGTLSELHSIQTSKTTTLGRLTSTSISTDIFLLSNESLDFRCCFGKIQLERDGTALLEQETAEALNLKPGDPFRYLPISEHHH